MDINDISLKEGERIDKINENLSLIQKKDGLTFGTDAYLLGAFPPVKNTVGADLGAGTGVASLLCLARNKGTKIYAAEIQPEFAELCRRNAELNGLNHKLIPICKDIRELTPKDTGQEVDFVISNPPYMISDGGKANESSAKNIARHEVHGNIADFCAAANRILKYGGDFYTVYRPDRLCELITALRDNNLEPKQMVTVYPRQDTVPCLVLIKSKKGGKPGLTLAPPLIIYREDGVPSEYSVSDNEKDLGYTDAFARIYREFSLDHLFGR